MKVSVVMQDIESSSIRENISYEAKHDGWLVVEWLSQSLGDILIKKRSGAWSEGVLKNSSGKLRQDYYCLILLFVATTTSFRSGTNLGFGSQMYELRPYGTRIPSVSAL
jgi:hypothetical protein